MTVHKDLIWSMASDGKEVQEIGLLPGHVLMEKVQPVINIAEHYVRGPKIICFIGNTSRLCNSYGRWDVADVRNCNSTDYHSLFDRICNVSC